MRLPMLISARTHTDTHTRRQNPHKRTWKHTMVAQRTPLQTNQKPESKSPSPTQHCGVYTAIHRQTERQKEWVTHTHTHIWAKPSKVFSSICILYIFLQEHLSPCNISGCCRGYKLSTEVHFQCSYLVRSKWWIILSWFNTSGTLILAYIFTPCCLPHSHHLAQWRESCIGPEHCLPAIPARTQTAKLLSEFFSLSESRHHFLFSKNHFFPLPRKTCFRFSAFVS